MPFPVGAAIAGGVGLINSIFNRRSSRRNVDATIGANREMAEYAYSKDLEMWNRQNAYNSPEEQMMRLEKAGLNPNLIYGKGGGSVGNTGGQMPKYNAPTMDYSGRLPIQLPQMIGMYQDFELKNAQIDNVKANTEILGLKEAIGTATKESVIGQAAAKLKLSKQSHQKGIEDIKIKELLQPKMALEMTERELDIIYKKFRNQWMEQGITGSDNIAFRIIVRMLGGMGLLTKEGIKAQFTPGEHVEDSINPYQEKK